MKKVELELDFVNERTKSKVMKKVSSLAGVESITLGKDKKMTVIGDIDPVLVLEKLNKLCNAKILCVGPKEAGHENKQEKKEGKEVVVEAANEAAIPVAPPYYYRHPSYDHQYYSYPPPSPFYRPVEEYPAHCVIC